MTKKMLIDASHAEETRVVVLDGSRLEDFDVETATRKQIKGNIYLAKVIRVEPSLQAAFVEYGGNRHGFLAFGEIHPDYYQIPVADRKRLLAQQAEEAAHELEEDDAPPATQALNAAAVEVIAETAAEQAPAEASEAQPEESPEETPAEAPAEGETSEPSENIEEVAPTPPPENLGGDGDDAAEARERRQKQRFLRNYKIQDVIHRRQIMLIQVVKEERGNKGAALTTYLSLAGRFSVLMPNSPSGGGVSRKITSVADRRRLKEAMNELDVPDGMGLIVRTAGANRPKPEIKRDCEYLLRLWDDIRDRTLSSTAPALIYEEASLIKRTIRDVYTRDVEEILVDGREGYTAAYDFMRMLMPGHAKKVRFWEEGQPLFAKYQVEAQLDAMLNPIVQLRSGGYIVINQTEALVAIDVNSGRSTRERSIEDTALRTNLEAAEEAAKQLRMRDLAGLIVIDFIDMESRKNNLAVERRVKEALKNDRARIQVGAISHFGLMELSRQRLRPSLAEASLVTCPHCSGMGQLRSPESAALHILRAIEDEGAKYRSAEIGVFLSQDTALYLFNQKRDRIAAIEARYGMRVFFSADPSLNGANFRIEKLKALLAAPPPPPPANTAPITAERHFIASPVTEEEESETEEDDAPKATDTAEEGERKRRRRRRRGKRRPDSAAPVAAPEGTEEPAPEPAAPVVVDDQPSEFDLVLAAVLGEPDDDAPTTLPAEPEAEAPAEEEPAPKRRRARGGRTRKTAEPEALITAESPQPETVFANVADIFEAAERAEAAAVAPPKPKRTRAVKITAAPAPEPLPEPVAEEPAPPPAAPVVQPIVIGADAPVVEKKRGWWRR